MRLFGLLIITSTLVACSNQENDIKSLSCSEHSKLIMKKEVAFAESNYTQDLLQDMLIS